MLNQQDQNCYSTVYVGTCPKSTFYICSYNSHIPVVYNTSSMNFKIDNGIQINNDYQCHRQIKLQVCLDEKVKDWNTIKVNELHLLAFNLNVLCKLQNYHQEIKKVYQFEVW